MIELFQSSGSASFAARAAIEEIGAEDATLHGAWWPIAKKGGDAEDQMSAHEASIEHELSDGDYCLGDRFSLADI